MVKTLLAMFVLLVTVAICYGQTAKESGDAKLRLEDYKGAIADYSKAIELNPKNAKAYYSRGLAKLLMGQKDSGCIDLSKAGELGYDKAYDAIKEDCR